MTFKGPVSSKIILERQILEQVQVFNYLGCDLSNDRNTDVDKKLSRFGGVCGLVRRTLNKQARQEAQLRFYNTVAVPILIYGSKVWVLRSWDESRIQAAETRFLRAVKGCTRVDRIRNEEIRRQLSVMPLLGKLKEYRKWWRDHLMRIPLCTLPSQV
ncbi:uncharacterized protein LOC142320395 [Lycorma delicatula]|uniref:uncharacterized protein LOC142320395 n=1 Tax=Lycorma delicatula TaxID=130591 RepID=UPI003F513826